MASGMEKNCGEKKVLQGRKVTKKGREEKYCNGGGEKLQINVEREKLLQGRKIYKESIAGEKFTKKVLQRRRKKITTKGRIFYFL